MSPESSTLGLKETLFPQGHLWGEEEGCDFSFCSSLNHFFQPAPVQVSLLSDKRPQGFSGL